MNNAADIYKKRADLNRKRLPANRFAHFYAPLVAAIVIAASVFGPSAISRHNDAGILGNIVIENRDDIEGFRYYNSAENISPGEKLYILSNALSNRILPQSDYSALIRLRNNPENAPTESFALLPNNKNDGADSKDEALNSLRAEFGELSKRGIIPEVKWNLIPNYYEISRFMAMDMLEPQKNVSVLLVDFTQTPQLSKLRNIPVSCYMDSETNKIYGFSIRTDKNWDYYDPDYIISEWSDYLGLSVPVAIPGDNALIEDTPYFRKYSVEGAGGSAATVTVGFYEGVNEFFIKISK